MTGCPGGEHATQLAGSGPQVGELVDHGGQPGPRSRLAAQREGVGGATHVADVSVPMRRRGTSAHPGRRFDSDHPDTAMSRNRFGPDACARAHVDHQPRSVEAVVGVEVRGNVPAPDLDALRSAVPNLVELTRNLDLVVAHFAHNIPRFLCV